MMMTHIEPTQQWSGTCNQGNINMSFNELVELLGPPHEEGRFDKTTTEWAFRWTNDEDDSGIFTVYDYYFSRSSDDNDKTRWSIGGNKTLDYFAFMDVIENQREDRYLNEVCAQ